MAGVARPGITFTELAKETRRVKKKNKVIECDYGPCYVRIKCHI